MSDPTPPIVPTLADLLREPAIGQDLTRSLLAVKMIVDALRGSDAIPPAVRSALGLVSDAVEIAELLDLLTNSRPVDIHAKELAGPEFKLLRDAPDVVALLNHASTTRLVHNSFSRRIVDARTLLWGEVKYSKTGVPTLSRNRHQAAVLMVLDDYEERYIEAKETLDKHRVVEQIADLLEEVVGSVACEPEKQEEPRSINSDALALDTRPDIDLRLTRELLDVLKKRYPELSGRLPQPDAKRQASKHNALLDVFTILGIPLGAESKPDSIMTMMSRLRRNAPKLEVGKAKRIRIIIHADGGSTVHSDCRPHVALNKRPT